GATALSWGHATNPMSDRAACSSGSGRRLQRLIATGCCLLVVAAAAPWRVGIVSGYSMTPTLPPGRVFFYERLSAADTVGAGDIVVVTVGGRTCVKRIYATGG